MKYTAVAANREHVASA